MSKPTNRDRHLAIWLILTAILTVVVGLVWHHGHDAAVTSMWVVIWFFFILPGLWPAYRRWLDKEVGS